MPSSPKLFVPALAALAAAKLGAQLATAPAYGIFRDELYYLACAEHLDFGYVDHAPLIAWTTWIARTLFGTSLFGLRLLPALAGTATLVLSVLLCRALGGGRWAQILTGVCVLVSGYFLAVDHLLTMNVFEPTLWTAAALLLLSALRSGKTASWLGFGLVAGIGLTNKHSMLFFGFALVVALLLSRDRRVFLGWRPWAALSLALLLLMPNLIWQMAHGWPTLEFMSAARASKHAHFTLLEFFEEQVLLAHPLTLPVWLGGVVHSLRRRDDEHAHFVGASYIVLFCVVLLGGGKPYYLAPILPIVYAAGGVAFERLFDVPRRRFVIPALSVLLLATGALLAPLAIPVLSQARLARYAQTLGMLPSSGEKHEIGVLPQHYADMHGWPELAGAVARVYAALSADDRRELVIYTENYGEAGAIDFFGPALGLPKATSGHNGYFLWGPGTTSGQVVIAIGESEARLRSMFDDVSLAATSDHQYAMPHERHTEIFVCRAPKRPWRELWPTLKHYR